MQGNPDWYTNFTSNFAANGIGGIVVAMGLTFIAFEGYEIIVQTGEEVKNPKKNIPRAVFISLDTCSIALLFGCVCLCRSEISQEYWNRQYSMAIHR